MEASRTISRVRMTLKGILGTDRASLFEKPATDKMQLSLPGVWFRIAPRLIFLLTGHLQNSIRYPEFICRSALNKR